MAEEFLVVKKTAEFIKEIETQYIDIISRADKVFPELLDLVTDLIFLLPSYWYR